METKYLKECLNNEWELNRVRMKEFTINVQYTIFVNPPKKTLKGNLEQAMGDYLN